MILARVLFFFNFHVLDADWDVMVDLFFYRKDEDIEEPTVENEKDEGKEGGQRKKWDTAGDDHAGEEEDWNA